MKKSAEAIGEMIRKARLEKKLTVRTLAEALSVSPGAVSNLENGKVQKIRPEHRQKLLEVLGVEFPDEIPEGDELDAIFDEWSLEPEERDQLRCALGGAVAKRFHAVAGSDLGKLERKIASVRSVMTNPTLLKLRKPEVVAALNHIGVPDDPEIRGNIVRILDDIEAKVFARIADIEDDPAFPPQSDFLRKVALVCGVTTYEIEADSEKQNQVKRELADAGLLQLAMEVDEAVEEAKFFGAVAMPCETGPARKYGLLLLSNTEEKQRRRLFTFAHELAHVLVDPSVASAAAPVHRYYGAPGHAALEWFVDQVAGRLVFPSAWTREKVEALAKSWNGHLDYTLVCDFRNEHFPIASHQAVLNAVVQYWPAPMLYVEAMRKPHKPQPGQTEPELGKLRISQVCLNSAAVEKKLNIPYRFVVPETSVLHKLYHEESFAFPFDPTTRIGQFEDMSSWVCEHGLPLDPMRVFVTAFKKILEDGTQIVRAFITPAAALEEFENAC